MRYHRATAVYTDNTSSQTLVTKPVHHTRMKQLHLKFLELRDLTEWGVIAPAGIRTTINPADVGTKSLGPHKFEPKADFVLSGVGNLEFEEVDRKLTEPNDASV